MSCIKPERCKLRETTINTATMKMTRSGENRREDAIISDFLWPSDGMEDAALAMVHCLHNKRFDIFVSAVFRSFELFAMASQPVKYSF